MCFSTNLSFQQPILNPIKDSQASHREDLDSRVFEIDHELRRFDDAENNILDFKVDPSKVIVHDPYRDKLAENLIIFELNLCHMTKWF